jgi:hypothetical protein
MSPKKKPYAPTPRLTPWVPVLIASFISLVFLLTLAIWP